jgi:hypothetical protein
MTSPHPALVRLSSPADLICMVPQLLGFTPSESVVVICLRGRRRRVGLAMRFDLADATDAGDPAAFAHVVHERVALEVASAAFVVVFSATALRDHAPRPAQLPHAAIANALIDDVGGVISDVVLTNGDRWWSYRCDDACCGGPAGVLIDPATPGATAVAAAYALAGQGVLPNRQAVVESVALEVNDVEAASTRVRISVLDARHCWTSQGERRVIVGRLIARLMDRLTDPRGAITTDEVAELAALCRDPVVRDEVLIRAADAVSRERLLPVLREVVRRVPPPFDAPVCAMLAWTAYADGDGVVANVAVERSLTTDPDYSLARLITDALYRQIPPRMLEAVMRGAAHDLGYRRDFGGRDEAG